MTDISRKPERRRWRRRLAMCILLLTLVMLSALGWWFYPAGDSRFVGRWQIIDADNADGGTLDLRSNGIGYVTKPLPLGNIASTPFPWHVTNGRLTYGLPKSGSYDWLSNGYLGIRTHFYGEQDFVIWQEVSQAILAVTELQIEMRNEAGKQTALIRITD